MKIPTKSTTGEILIVDCDGKSRHAIASRLQHAGMPCAEAASAAIGLEMARQEMPALLVVDTQLDGCTGFEFVEAINREYLGNDIPIIFIAANGQPDLIERCHAAGGTYVLSKPLDPTVLVELVDKALWMPHLVRRHIDNVAHPATPKPRILTDAGTPVSGMMTISGMMTS